MAERVVVELGVAVAVERVAARVVADCPVLVVEVTVGVDRDLVTSREPAVG
jgi:hypothetical protein